VPTSVDNITDTLTHTLHLYIFTVANQNNKQFMVVRVVEL